VSALGPRAGAPGASPRAAAVATLVLALAVLGFAGGAAWAAVRRSTWPLSLDHVVVGKVVLHEKHPGVDDAFFLDLRPRTGIEVRRLRVDASVFGAVRTGDALVKRAGSATLTAAGRGVPLAASAEARGLMLGLAPLLAVVASLLGVSVRRRR